VRDVQLGNRNVGGCLLEDKAVLWPEGRRCQQPELWLDRVWTSLAPPISVAPETEVSIVKGRSLPEKAVDRGPQRREARVGPGAVVSPLQFVTRRHTDQNVRFRGPRGDSSSTP
jgi:hypothetical protein